MGDIWELDKVEIGAFKSYGDRVMIGPFKRFTCIVGPNGSGKSNVMDALSFVLGVDRKHLRSNTLKDLIHRKENEDPAEASRRAMVTLCMRKKNGSPGSLVFQRSITPSGATSQRMNARSCSFEEYVQELAKINVLVQAKNFLVFQGDVDGLASRQGKALTELIEKVSGSEQYAEEYARLQREKQAAESTTRDVLAKKRTAVHEKKQLELQRDEALQFQQAQEQWQAKKTEKFLLRLFRLDTEKAALEDRGKVRAEAEATCKAKLEAELKKSKDFDRDRARGRIEAAQIEREISKRKQAVDQAKPPCVGAESRAKTLGRRVQDLAAELQREQQRTQQQQQKLAQFEQEKQQVLASLAKLKQQAQSPLALQPGQLARVEQVEEQVRQQSLELAQEQKQVEHQLEDQKQLLGAKQRERQELDQRRRGLVTLVDDLGREEARLQRQCEEASQQLAAQREQGKHDHAERQTSVQKVLDLEKERDGLLTKLQLINANQHQIKRDERNRQTVAELMRFFPGVKGRFMDLVKPLQKRVEVAVSVAMGRLADAVIVDKSTTGQKCIEHLKERLCEPMTFIPLDDIRAPNVDAGLGRIKDAQLALNCVQYERSLDKAVRFVFGETLFVPDLKTARTVAFKTIPSMNRGLVKVVTHDGERISKNCNMSVDTDVKVSRHEVAAAAELGQRVQAIGAELHRLQNKAEVQPGTLELQTRALEDQVQVHTLRLERLEQSLKAKRHELSTVDNLLLQHQPQIDAATKAVQLSAEKAEKLRQQILHQGKKQYADLSKELGIPDVGRALHEQQKLQQRLAEEETSGLARVAQLSAEMELLQRGQCPQLAQDLQQCTQLHTEAQAKALELRTQLDELEKAQDEFLQQQHQKRGGDDELEQSYRDAREHVAQLKQKLAHFAQQNASDSARAKALVVESKDVLRQALFQDVSLPVELGEAGDSQSLTQESLSKVDKGAKYAVSYDDLPAAAHTLKTQRELDAMLEQTVLECERLEVEVSGMRPNLKAVERYSDMAEKVSETNLAADHARKLSSELERQFNEVKKQRREKFMQCYTHIAEKIEAIYRELTTYSDAADGGSAYLDLENEDEPYLRGVTFTTRVPSKRFRDLALQSGGERTVAALAMLFALHSYAAPPFLILDEVDAALDAQHVDALVRFLRQADFQAVVISLKDKLYSESDALVGVYKPKDTEESKVLTLDLQQFEA